MEGPVSASACSLWSGTRAVGRSCRLLRFGAVTDLLPEFPYHPDPVATGVIVPSATACLCCGRERGYVYRGPVYAAEELGGRLRARGALRTAAPPNSSTHTSRRERAWATTCPWRSSRRSTGALRVSPRGRSPGGSSTAATVLRSWAGSGPPNSPPIPRHWRCCGGRRTAGAGRMDQVEHFLGSLDKDGEATAYLFRCRICAAHLAYTDFA